MSAAQRWRVESRNRRVEVTLDYAELRGLAAAEGLPLADVLTQFRAAGATSVAIPEDTVGGLEEARRLTVIGAGRAETHLLPETGLAGRIQAAARGKTRFAVTGRETRSGLTLTFGQPYALVRAVGVGIDPETVAEVRAAGLGVVGRVGNWDGVTPDGLRWTLGQLREQGVSTVIFSGDAVPGFKGRVVDNPDDPGRASTESLLRAFGLYYGAVEFVKQKGDGALARAAADRTVRVHTISGAEMQSADIPANVQRFLLGARERNIRLLFVRLFPQEPGALTANTKYVEQIARGLERGDLARGPAHGFDPLATPPALRLIMGLGLAGAWCLLLDAITGLLGGATLRLRAVAALGGIMLVALPVAPGGGVKLAALTAACLFPMLALVHTDLLAPAANGSSLPNRAALALALRRFLAATGITLLGVVFVVGLLADRLFLIKADAFLGIKAAQLFPVLLAAGIYGLGLRASAERPWPQVVGETRRDITALGGEPIRLWQVAVGLVGLIALALLVLRSGNDPGVGVSSLELRIRALLDRLLYARPRFKEFLIGHPAMIVALGLAVTGRRKWALPLFLVGAIGQVSLLNTFCHLHTPLWVSLIRALLGVAIGVIIGMAAYLVIDRFTRRCIALARWWPVGVR